MSDFTLQWRHNELDGVSNHQPHDCLLNRLFKTQIKESIKAPLRWPLCGKFTVTGDFLAQMASNAENVSIWWRHHEKESTRLLSLTNPIFRMRPNHPGIFRFQHQNGLCKDWILPLMTHMKNNGHAYEILNSTLQSHLSLSRSSRERRCWLIFVSPGTYKNNLSAELMLHFYSPPLISVILSGIRSV